MNQGKLCCIVMAAVLLSMGTPALADSAAERAIVAAGDGWVEAFNAGDSAGVAGFYTADAQLLPPNSEFQVGTEAIRQTFQALMDAGAVRVEIQPQETVVKSDIAYRVNRFTVFDAAGQEIDRGKALEVWKRLQGKWKLHRDMWSSNLPATGGQQVAAAGH